MKVLNLIVHKEFIQLRRFGKLAENTLSDINKLEESEDFIRELPWWNADPIGSLVGLKNAKSLAKGYDLVILHGARRSSCLDSVYEDLHYSGIPVAYGINTTTD